MVGFTMEVVLCAEELCVGYVGTGYLLHGVELIHRPRVGNEEQAYARWNKERGENHLTIEFHSVLSKFKV